MTNGLPTESPMTRSRHQSSTVGLVLTIVIALVLVKTVGVVGALVAFAAYSWLQPRIGTWLALLAAALVGIAVGVVLTVYLAQQPLPQQPVAIQRTSIISKSPWSYTHNTNAMTGDVTHIASVADGHITLERIAKSTGDSQIQLDAYWRRLCDDWEQCSVLVRFDNSEAQRYRVRYKADQLKTAILEDHDKFIPDLLVAKRVRISQDPYAEGGRFLEFDVSDFDEGRFWNDSKLK